jgi:hypothetical protein
MSETLHILFSEDGLPCDFRSNVELKALAAVRDSDDAALFGSAVGEVEASSAAVGHGRLLAGNGPGVTTASTATTAAATAAAGNGAGATEADAAGAAGQPRTQRVTVSRYLKVRALNLEARQRGRDAAGVGMSTQRATDLRARLGVGNPSRSGAAGLRMAAALTDPAAAQRPASQQAPSAVPATLRVPQTLSSASNADAAVAELGMLMHLWRPTANSGAQPQATKMDDR